MWIGGICEFATTMFSVLGITLATSNGINAGVALVLIPLSNVIVSVASYFLFGERLQIAQILGVLVVILGATLIVLFPTESDADDDETVDAEASLEQVLIVLLYSLLVAIFLSIQLLVSKTLARRGVEGKFIGFFYLLAQGSLGTICLIAATIAGEGIFLATGEIFWLMMLSGVTGVVAISILQYSVSIGIAGIASSIYNTNVVYFTALCFLFLD